MENSFEKKDFFVCAFKKYDLYLRYEFKNKITIMEKEKLNLVDILKDVPSGVEFHSTVYGKCTFDKVEEEDTQYPIRIEAVDKKGVKSYEYLTSDGRNFFGYDGECTLFPSKENRSWEGWKYNSLKEGDPVMVSDGDHNFNNWHLRIYTKFNEAEVKDCHDTNVYWKYIVPIKDFDFENIESNIQKSVV